MKHKFDPCNSSATPASSSMPGKRRRPSRMDGGRLALLTDQWVGDIWSHWCCLDNPKNYCSWKDFFTELCDEDGYIKKRRADIKAKKGSKAGWISGMLFFVVKHNAYTGTFNNWCMWSTTESSWKQTIMNIVDIWCNTSSTTIWPC